MITHNSGMFITQRVNIENFANVICYSHESVKKLKKHGGSQQKQKFISRQMELMDQDECFRHVYIAYTLCFCDRANC